VADGYIVTDIGCSTVVGTMDNSTILDIGIIADLDVINIAPDNRVEPY
jgi:hypothetical protein